MRDINAKINAIAARQRRLINRTQVVAVGGGDRLIWVRNDQHFLRPRHDGVYIVGPGELDWEGEVQAGVLLAQGQGLAFGRTACALRGLDAFPRGIIEVLVRHGEELSGEGVVLHRTRRMPEGELVRGIPTTPIERSLVDAARFVPPIVLEKGMESAVRKGFTTATAIDLYLNGEGKRLRGTTKLRAVMARRPKGGPAGSPAEVDFLDILRRAGAPMPVRQLRVDLGDEEYASLDYGWEDRKRAILYDGWDVHSGRQARDQDLAKRERLREIGWALLEVSKGFTDDPERAARRALRFLGEIRAA